MLRRKASAPTPGSSEPYAELTPHYKQLRADVASLMSHPHVSGSPILMSLPEGWSIDGAAPEDVVRLGTALVRGPWSATTLGPRCSNILSMIGAVQQLEALLHSAAQAALADAIVSSAALPPKLNTLVQPLMGALRREPDPLLSARAGSAIAHLALLCVNRKPSPNAKVWHFESAAPVDIRPRPSLVPLPRARA